MKYAAIFMILLVAVGLVLGVYAYANARLTVADISVSESQGFEKAAEFAALQSAMDNGALMGTAYSESLPGSGLDYVFETYTFRLKNSGLIDAEMVEVQPVPVSGDMLAYTSLEPAQVNANVIVPSRGEQDAYCVVLRSASQDEFARMQRSFRITYYLWGIPRTMTVRYQ